jgi:hypothetical protein
MESVNEHGRVYGHSDCDGDLIAPYFPPIEPIPSNGETSILLLALKSQSIAFLSTITGIPTSDFITFIDERSK